MNTSTKVRAFILLLLALAPATALLAQPAAAGGRVTITYTLQRARKIASDQFAIWIEDEKGQYVRTLFATDFVSRRGGWKKRPQTTPTWVAAAGIANAPQSAIDAMSGATPANGVQTVVWDLKDRAGKGVAPGTYRYRIEGNISWANTVLWTGTIRVGGARDSSAASPVHSPPEAAKLGSLISAVAAVYEPGN